MGVELPRTTTNFFVFIGAGLIFAVLWFSLPDCSDTEVQTSDQPAGWSAIETGMTQDEVRGQLGAPHLAYEDMQAQGITVEYWEYSQRSGPGEKRLTIRFEDGIVADRSIQ